jgi:hypothetical protein
VLAIGGFIVYQFIPQDYSKHSPARNYQYPEPSAEAKNRQLVCDDFREYKINPGKYKPLCLNLYSVTVDQINAANTGGQNDVILLYGQYATFRLYLPSSPRDVENVGESFLRIAKFNDLITIPKLMDWYNLASLDYIPKELSPYPALAFHFADQEGIKDICGGYAAGCALLNFQTVIKDSFLSDNKDVGNLLRKDNGDELEYTVKMPGNCYAKGVIIHEVAHNFLVANKIAVKGMVTDGWLDAPTYFNENLTELITLKLTDEICGAGSIEIEKMIVGGQPATGGVVEFNAAFPPAALHPTSYPKDNQCEQALISSYSKYLLKGDYETRFKKFIIDFRNAMKEKAMSAYDDDKLMAKFMLKMIGNDPAEKEFLKSHACEI